MYRTLVFMLLLSLTFSCKNETKKPSEEKTTTYYLIRHAEKDRSAPSNPNPVLTEKGTQRAKHWATYFDTIPLNKIFSTNYLRTQQTAALVAKNKNLPIIPYDPKNVIDAEFLKATEKNQVLIVGHSNTTPMLVNQILKQQKYEDIPDNDNSRLYVVQLKNGQATSEIRTVNLPN